MSAIVIAVSESYPVANGRGQTMQRDAMLATGKAAYFDWGGGGSSKYSSSSSNSSTQVRKVMKEGIITTGEIKEENRRKRIE